MKDMATIVIVVESDFKSSIIIFVPRHNIEISSRLPMASQVEAVDGQVAKALFKEVNDLEGILTTNQLNKVLSIKFLVELVTDPTFEWSPGIMRMLRTS